MGRSSGSGWRGVRTRVITYRENIKTSTLLCNLPTNNWVHNSSHRSYLWFDMQTRQKGQFCFVLTLSPHLNAFLNSRLNSNNSYWTKLCLVMHAEVIWQYTSWTAIKWLTAFYCFRYSVLLLLHLLILTNSELWSSRH